MYRTQNYWCEPHCFFMKANLISILTGAMLESVCDSECWEFLFGANAAEKYASFDDVTHYGVCENQGISNITEFMSEYDLAPINAWTSYAQIFIGNFFVSKALGEGEADEVYGQRTNLFQRHPILPFLLGVSYFLNGAGSYVYHASLTKFGHFLDYANIMVTVSFVSFYCVVDRFEGYFDESHIEHLVVAAWMAIVIVSYFFTYRLAWVYTAVAAPILLIAGIYCGYSKDSRGTSNDYLIKALVSFIAALLFFEVPADTGWPVCVPESWFQPHAIWHVLAGIGMLFLGDWFYAEHGVVLHY